MPHKKEGITAIISKYLKVVDESLKQEQGELIELAKTKNIVLQIFFYIGLTFITILLIILKAIFPSQKEE